MNSIEIPKSTKRKRWAIWGCCGLLGLILVIAALWHVIIRHEIHRILCAYSLTYPLELALRSYSQDHSEHLYPPMSSMPGELFVDFNEIYPDYFYPDSGSFFCSAMDKDFKMIPFEEKVARPTYVYFGYVLQNEDEVLAFLESYPAFIEDQVSFNDDLPAPMGRGSLGGDVFLRLSAKSLDEKEVLRGTLPLMFELPDYTDNSFLFRHGENAGYVKYPGCLLYTSDAADE